MRLRTPGSDRTSSSPVVMVRVNAHLFSAEVEGVLAMVH